MFNNDFDWKRGNRNDENAAGECPERLFCFHVDDFSMMNAWNILPALEFTKI